MNNSDQHLGLVKEGKFMLLTPESYKGKVVSVTEDSMVVGRQIQEIDLGEYEGTAIMIEGEYRGDWIYAAHIIDQAGPILTALVQKAYNK